MKVPVNKRTLLSEVSVATVRKCKSNVKGDVKDMVFNTIFYLCNASVVVWHKLYLVILCFKLVSDLSLLCVCHLSCLSHFTARLIDLANVITSLEAELLHLSQEEHSIAVGYFYSVPVCSYAVASFSYSTIFFIVPVMLLLHCFILPVMLLYHCFILPVIL